MISMVMYLSGKNPTIHLGGNLPLINGSTRVGGQDIFVAEACEYKDSFLRFFPTVAVILNIDADHLDYFKDLDDIEDSFREFTDLLPSTGCAIGNGDDPRACKVVRNASCKGETFGYGEDCDWKITDVRQEKGLHSFALIHNGSKAAEVSLRIPGRHNVMNAAAAIAACSRSGIDPQEAADIIHNFTGAQRRFEKAGEYNGAGVYHDYAHHPTEIRATLSAAKQMTSGKLYCIFQPHTYSRTRVLFNEFAASFSDTDRTVLVDIYAAREADPGNVSSKMLAAAANAVPGQNVLYAKSFDEASAMVRSWVSPGDNVITLGAGDIEKMSKLLIQP